MCVIHNSCICSSISSYCILCVCACVLYALCMCVCVYVLRMFVCVKCVHVFAGGNYLGQQKSWNRMSTYTLRMIIQFTSQNLLFLTMQNSTHCHGNINTSQTHEGTHPYRHVTFPIMLQSTPHNLQHHLVLLLWLTLLVVVKNYSFISSYWPTMLHQLEQIKNLLANMVMKILWIDVRTSEHWLVNKKNITCL